MVVPALYDGRHEHHADVCLPAVVENARYLPVILRVRLRRDPVETEVKRCHFMGSRLFEKCEILRYSDAIRIELYVLHAVCPAQLYNVEQVVS